MKIFNAHLSIDLGKINFEAYLGSGCYGGPVCLYRSVKDNRSRRIVIKSVPYDSVDYAYDTVLMEHTILSQANHPRILRYFGYFETETAWKIVTEYAERGNLAAFLHRRQVHGAFLKQRVVMAKFRDMAEALLYLHQRKVIHRDLKPANVLIDAGNRLKLADFGISKVCPHLSWEDELNMSIVGTPRYMAPEVATGQPYNYKSDVWPLGIIFYELCMLKYPIEGLAEPNSQGSRRRFRTPQINCAALGYQPDMQMLCEMMLQVKPKKRWMMETILKNDRVRALMG